MLVLGVHYTVIEWWPIGIHFIINIYNIYIIYLYWPIATTTAHHHYYIQIFLTDIKYSDARLKGDQLSQLRNEFVQNLIGNAQLILLLLKIVAIS